METPIVAVSLNYRLAAWGLLAGDEIAAEGGLNNGLLDQRLALRWIQENIAAFGGDPRKVTIWGESAYVVSQFTVDVRGGGSVTLHMAAYGGRNDDLFKGAIIESGVALNQLESGTAQTANNNFHAAVQSAGCSQSTHKLDCLRSLPYHSLYEAFRPVWRIPYLPPVIDDDFIRGDLVQAYKHDQFVAVPLLVGDNTDEGSGLAAVAPLRRFDHDIQVRRFIQGYQLHAGANDRTRQFSSTCRSRQHHELLSRRSIPRSSIRSSGKQTFSATWVAMATGGSNHRRCEHHRIYKTICAARLSKGTCL